MRNHATKEWMLAAAWAVACCCLVWTGYARGAEIECPASVAEHSLVKARCLDEAKGHAWFVMGPIGMVEAVQYDGGKNAAFTGPPGRYQVMLVVSGEEGRLDQAYHEVIIAGEEPTPDPSPEPTPEPTPDPIPEPDAGRYGLSKLARDSVALVELPDADRATQAQAMARTFDSIASAIAAGVLTTPAQILNETTARNKEVLGGDNIAWRAWVNALGVKELYDSGKMRAASDFAIAWREIAAGLKLVVSFGEFGNDAGECDETAERSDSAVPEAETTADVEVPSAQPTYEYFGEDGEGRPVYRQCVNGRCGQ